jgi:EAL domain-containing protein (putative c-di-GMP-specific phosphodiesterase class I)
LSYLKLFNTDKLKIDQSFIFDLPKNKDDVILVKTIIAMGENMKMSILAEGIETKEQLDFLKSLGCQFGQGYYFSKPLPADQCYEFLQNHHKKHQIK